MEKLSGRGNGGRKIVTLTRSPQQDACAAGYGRDNEVAVFTEKGRGCNLRVSGEVSIIIQLSRP